MRTDHTSDLRPVLDRFESLFGPDGEDVEVATGVSRLSGGLINDTYALGSTHILQRLHRIFRPEVNLDIVALTEILRERGLAVPRLSLSSSGEPWAEISDPEALAGTWRIMTRLPGTTLHRVESPQQVTALAEALGAFHTALLGVEHQFNFVRRAPHDTNLHMMRLWTALDDCGDHRLFGDVEAIARALFDLWKGWGEEPVLPRRIVHGDPKVSNFLFGEAGQISGIVDLDTMAWGSLDSELGDALRSWCAAGEGASPQTLSLDLMSAAAAAYLGAVGAWVTDAEVAALPAAAERISIELAARFATDALREDYFGWDPEVAPTRGDHNLLRARNQLSLCRDLAHHRPAISAIFAAAHP